MNVTIGIPAYNEEKNIGNLLNDILNQKFEHDTLEKILVVSDGSNDKTDEIVLCFMKRYPNIDLIKKEKRMGKIDSLGIIFNTAKGDILILLDADTRLDTNTLNSLEKLFGIDNIGLIAGNPIPYIPDNPFNIAEQASFFNWILMDRIKNTYPPNLYHAHGRILALAKKLYKNVTISNILDPGDDQWIYLNCIKNKYRFEYDPNSRVFYKSPKTIKDYLKQNIRFTLSIKEKEKIFGRTFMKKHMKNNPLILFDSFLRYPYKGICWITLYTVGKLLAIIKRQRMSLAWEISESTK